MTWSRRAPRRQTLNDVLLRLVAWLFLVSLHSLGIACFVVFIGIVAGVFAPLLQPVVLIALSAISVLPLGFAWEKLL